MRIVLLLITAGLAVGCQSASRQALETSISRPPVVPVKTPVVDPAVQAREARFLDFLGANLEASRSMGRQALRESSFPTIKELAEQIVATNAQPAEQVQRLRREHYSSIPPTPAYQLEGEEIGPMMVPGGAESYSSRWYETMLSQLRAASRMCDSFANETENDELKSAALRIGRLEEELLSRLQALPAPAQ